SSPTPAPSPTPTPSPTPPPVTVPTVPAIVPPTSGGTTSPTTPTPHVALGGTLSSLRVQGMIQSINSRAGQITINQVGREPVTVNLAPSTILTKNGNPATLADLSAGDAILALYRNDGDTKTAISISAQTPQVSVQGFIAQIDARGIIKILDKDSR